MFDWISWLKLVFSYALKRFHLLKVPPCQESDNSNCSKNCLEISFLACLKRSQKGSKMLLQSESDVSCEYSEHACVRLISI